MYLWQRLAAPAWWAANEEKVRAEGGDNLATIERPGRKRLTVEIPCRLRTRAMDLRHRFGGRVVKLGRDWLQRFAREQKTRPLRIGDRLIISNVEEASASRLRGPSRPRGRFHIVIPAGAAFGTGQHSTTAMSLRLLEQLTRNWTPGWSMADLGTGSGILALAAKSFGAGRVMAIDIDPVAISTAKGNARLNRISGVSFRVADVLRFRLPARIDLVTANLFSELLIATLPRLRRVPWLIVSGVMREQEPEVVDALKHNRIEIVETRRRGRWIAILAKATKL